MSKNVVIILFIFINLFPIIFEIDVLSFINTPNNAYACTGDIDNDGDVDGIDLSVISSEIGRTNCSSSSPCHCDFDADRDVDNDDLAFFLTNFSKADCPIRYAPEDVYLGFTPIKQQYGAELAGETILISTGNALEYRQDLIFPSPHSHDLTFRTIYNSRSTKSGVPGYGWNHSYGASLTPTVNIDGTNYLKIIAADGRAYYFQGAGTNLYTGSFNELSQVISENGEFIWQQLDGSRRVFSSTGCLLRIEDEKGNLIVLTYVGDLLHTVTDTSSNRSLTLYYNAYNLIDHINGPVTEAVTDGIWVSYTYDLNDNPTSIIYADGSGFSYSYNDPNDIHNLTEKHDTANHLLKTLAYDTEDRAIANFCVQGRGVDIDYLNETLVSVCDAYDTQRIYTLSRINQHKRVTAMTGMSGAPYSRDNSVRWDYNNNLCLDEVEYSGGSVNHFSNYDERGNPESAIIAKGSPAQKSITYTYHPTLNRPLTRTESSVLTIGNRETIWDYDDDCNATANENPTNLLYRIIDAGYTKDASGTITAYEYVTTLTYNSKGQILTIDGPLSGDGDTTTFTYDNTTAVLLTITRPPIGTTTFSNYDAAGNIGLITDINDRATSFEYDGQNRITKITLNSDNSSTTIAYNTAGFPASITDPDGITKTFTYDAQYGHLTKTTAADGSYISNIYDTQGNRIEMSFFTQADIRTLRKRWSYQGTTLPGKLWKEINHDDTFTEYSYDDAANIATITDAKNQTTQYSHDALNRLTAITRPGYIVTSYGYDLHENLITVTDPELQPTTYTYDDKGRTIARLSPDSGLTSYLYDNTDNLTQKTDANGITTIYTHDLMKRLTATHFPDPTQDIVLSYDNGNDGIGRLTEMSDPGGTTTFSYDSHGRLTTKTSTIDDHNYAISRLFTPGNRQTSLTYPSNRTLNFSRDTFGKISTITTTLNGTNTTLFENLNYQPFGSPTAVDTGASGSAANNFDENYRLTTANPGAETERNFTYDANNNLNARTQPDDSRRNRSFIYDTLNQLTRTSGPYGTISYTYDNTGNRLSRSINGATETYTYTPGTNRVLAITGTNPATFTHDLNGNLTSKSDIDFIYNQNNRLIRVEQNTNILSEYTYNGNEQRVKKTVDGSTTIYHYDLNGNLLSESQPNGTITAEHLYMGSVIIATVQSGIFSYYLNDYLGTPIAVIDETRDATWEADYQPFGTVKINENSTTENHFRLPGQFFDTETGLHYNHHRYYDPETGRYITPDPIGLVGGINLYEYAGNNPINWVDPEGLAWRQKRPLDMPGLRGTTIWPLHHDRFLYDDGTDSGYYSDNSVRPDDAPQTLVEKYKNIGKYLNDQILREAEKIVKPHWNKNPTIDYTLGIHDCQDYGDSVMQEYDRIMKGKSKQNGSPYLMAP